ncbi:hypothetical protein GCM10027175_31420 [Hymenobacter latericoloratus]
MPGLSGQGRGRLGLAAVAIVAAVAVVVVAVGRFPAGPLNFGFAVVPDGFLAGLVRVRGGSRSGEGRRAGQQAQGGNEGEDGGFYGERKIL